MPTGKSKSKQTIHRQCEFCGDPIKPPRIYCSRNCSSVAKSKRGMDPYWIALGAVGTYREWRLMPQADKDKLIDKFTKAVARVKRRAA